MQCVAFTPTIIVKSDARIVAYRASCNSWACPVCSQKRARKEYARIVKGIDAIEQRCDYPLFFITLTAQSHRTQSLVAALSEYGYQTNKLMNAIRIRAVRELGASPYYVAVTELQKRGYPHTHMIIAGYVRRGFYRRSVSSWRVIDGYRRKVSRDTIGDAWLERELVSSGFGTQYDIQYAANGGGLSRYLAKYLFKSLPQYTFPKNWRRIRYSRNFPKLPERSVGDAEVTVLLKNDDYKRYARSQASPVIVNGDTELERDYLYHYLNARGIRAVRRKSGQA